MEQQSVEQQNIVLHYVEFGDELWTHTKLLEPDEFQNKLDQYDPHSRRRKFQLNLDNPPDSEKACSGYLNRLLHQVQRT